MSSGGGSPGAGSTRPPGGRPAPSSTRVTGGAAQRNLSPKTLDLGRGFLSALFMAVRTAQIHDASNRAFERAVQGVRVAAEALFAATGGFSVSFVEESAFLNGVRLRFDGGTFDSMRTLRHILESKSLGGIEMRAPPAYEAIRQLITLFSPSAPVSETRVASDLLAAQIELLGVQRFADQSRDGVKIDRRVFAVQSYAKLLLALREQRVLSAKEGGAGMSHVPRLRAVRVVQDLVELAGDRLDFLLRLGSNHAGAPIDELHGVNVSLLSIVLAHALGLGRQDQVDVGVAGLFHDVGRSDAAEPRRLLGHVPRRSVVPAEASGDVLSDPTPIDPFPLAARIPEEHLATASVVDPAERRQPATAAPAYDGPLDVIPDGDDQPLEPGDSLHFISAADIDPDGFLQPADTLMERVDPYHPMSHVEDAGQPLHPEECLISQEHPHTSASFARLLAAGGLSRAGLVRAVVAAEHHSLTGEHAALSGGRPVAHLFSRIVAVADAYDALTSGLGSDNGVPVHPLDALAMLSGDRSARFDPKVIDLLINILRAFPAGTEVVLESGQVAVVASHAGGTRWDRPVVRTATTPPRIIDLMALEGDRFATRIVGTRLFMGHHGGAVAEGGAARRR